MEAVVGGEVVDGGDAEDEIKDADQHHHIAHARQARQQRFDQHAQVAQALRELNNLQQPYDSYDGHVLASAEERDEA